MGNGESEHQEGDRKMKALPKEWTQENEKLLSDLWIGGKSVEEIAIQMNRTQPSVRGRMLKLNLRSVRPGKQGHIRWDAEKDHKLKSLYSQGVSPAAIACEFNSSISSITNRIHATGIARHPINTNPWTQEERDLAKSLVIDQKMGLAKASVSFNRSIAALRAHVETLGWKPWIGGRTSFEEEFRNRVIDMKKSGMMAKEIAVSTGKSIFIINKICSEELLGRFSIRPWDQQQKETLLRLMQEKAPPKEVMKTLRRSWESLIKMIGLMFGDEKPEFVKRFIYSHDRHIHSLMHMKVRQATDRSAEWKRHIDIDEKWIEYLLNIQNYKCYYTGVPFNLSKSNGNTFSIERVDSDKGYTKDNVVLILADLNRMKWELSLDRFIDLCGRVTTRFKDRPLGALPPSGPPFAQVSVASC